MSTGTVTFQQLSRALQRSDETFSIASTAVVGWVGAFAALAWLRFKIAASAGGGIHEWLAHVSALECIEVVLLARLLVSMQSPRTLGAAEAIAWLLAAGYLSAMPDRPLVAGAILTFGLLIRFASLREHRAFVLGLFLFVLQYNVYLRQPFMAHGASIADLDAMALRGLLRWLGYAVVGDGTVVFNPAEEFGIDVLSGCSSTGPLMIVLPAFAIVVLGLRGWFVRSDLVFAAGLVAATVCANLVRLAPVALSRAGYDYWHNGEGADVVGLAYALLAVGAALLAIRQAPAAKVVS